jgi:hypothetical protein
LPDLKQTAEETLWPALVFGKEELERLLRGAGSLMERVEVFKAELQSLTAA